MVNELSRVLRREGQLNLLAYLLILFLIATAGLLGFTVLADLRLPDLWLLRNHIVRTFVIGLLLMTILYMADQHRRLRATLLEIHTDLANAKFAIQESYDRLAFAHRAATTMTSLAHGDGLNQVLAESTGHFRADVAAIIGEEDVTMHTDGVDSREAHSAVLQVALDAVRAGKPLSVVHGGTGNAIAVPLRVNGTLKSVCCLWRRESAFSEDQLEGLGLVGRIIELSMENRCLLEAVSRQLDGTLQLLSRLVNERHPAYAQHSRTVTELAVKVGRTMRLTEAELKDLRLAAMLHDVGMLQLPEPILSSTAEANIEYVELLRSHADAGADLLATAKFGEAVQQAVRHHHEHLDGTGYPQGLRGNDIGQLARILAAVDAYDRMTSGKFHDARLSRAEAIRELMAAAGRRYDERVVETLIGIVGYSQDRPTRGGGRPNVRAAAGKGPMAAI